MKLEKQSTEWRFDVIVNRDILVAHMDFAGYTCRTLAAAVEAELRKTAKAGQKIGCSHSTIGHYRTGRRKNCDPNRAKAIAKALRTPISPLFLPVPSRVLSEARRKTAV